MNERLCLVHHGIKGQKWGVRRYRNPDGTLTPAGKKRYAKGNIDVGIANKGIEGVRRVTQGATRVTSNAQVRNRYNTRKNLTQEEMDSMSDNDLRTLVNRLNLEQQYSQLTEDKTAGARVRRGLDSIEGVLSIAGGALAIAVAYRELTK